MSIEIKIEPKNREGEAFRKFLEEKKERRLELEKKAKKYAAKEQKSTTV